MYFLSALCTLSLEPMLNTLSDEFSGLNTMSDQEKMFRSNIKLQTKWKYEGRAKSSVTNRLA